MLILVCGLPGSGKTTLARALEKRFSAVRLSSDEIRKELYPQPAYSNLEKERVYGELALRAEKALMGKKSVIADATFYRKAHRQRLLDAAEKAGTEAHIVLCTLNEAELRERISGRKPGSMSDADFKVYLLMKGEFEQIDGAHVEVDGALPVDERIETAVRFVESGWVRRLVNECAFELIETHISWVLLGKEVYKIKKPVKFSFLDFSTLKKRKFFCEEEIRLNSRLAKDVYLGVVTIAKANGGPVIGGKGEVLAYAVKMRRLDEKRMLSRMLEAKAVGETDVKRLAGVIADFHSAAEVKRGRFGSPALVWKHISALGDWRDAIEKSCGLGSEVDLVLERSKRFVEANGALLAKRKREGRIRECHGDLHAANVFFEDDIKIVDCIEFSEEYRCVDVASDLAFMAMDLDAFGEEGLSGALVDEYLARANEANRPEFLKLLDFHKCYRANVRAKIAAIEWTQKKNPESAARIKKYITLAMRYAEGL